MTSDPQPSNVAAFPTQVTAHVERIDPNTAKRWLESNIHNRNTRPEQIKKYVRDIQTGRWQVNGEAIKFAADGTLLDGQHRLRAIIATDTAVDSLVVYGLAIESQDVMDTGIARRAGDMLSLKGKRNSNALSAAVSIAIRVGENDRPSRREGNRVSHSETLQWIADHPDIEDAVNRVSGQWSREIRLTHALSAYCLYRLSRVDVFAAEEFFDRLATRANLPLGSPILTLANRLDRIAVERRKITNNERIWMVFRAWNAWRSRESLTRLVLPDEITTLPTPK